MIAEDYVVWRRNACSKGNASEEARGPQGWRRLGGGVPIQVPVVRVRIRTSNRLITVRGFICLALRACPGSLMRVFRARQ